MSKTLFILLILQIFFSSYKSEDNVILQINRSKSHSDQSGTLTPLVVTLSSEDKAEKVRGVDLICVVDVSGSMSSDNRMNLVKESLKYLVNLMNSQDNLAIVTFSSSSSQLFGLTQMNDENKNKVIPQIEALRAYGGTNIYSGLTRGLDLITKDYSSEDRVASMILLSDGIDQGSNTDTNFRNYITRQNKYNFAFTLHTLGYGASHQADLMYKLSKIRDGGYFFIRYLSTVTDAILEIYGSLSTNYKKNVELTLTSNYVINNVYGKEDLFYYNLKNGSPNTFNAKIIHFVYGKRYDFVALVNIPTSVQSGTIVLNATVSPFGKKAYYRWDNSNLDPFAYEEYIRGISADFIQKSYDYGASKGITTMNSAFSWISLNYDGTRDWKTEYNGIIEDFRNYKTYGQANILSKLRELKTSQLGIHYNNENSYQRKIIDGAYYIDTETWTYNDTDNKQQITPKTGNNYIHFYLKEGIGEINGVHFSGKSSSLVFYSEEPIEYDVVPITPTMKYYYNEEKRTRIQSRVDFSTGGKFVFKKDFPFDLYTAIDGAKDLVFNIQFLKLEYNKTEEENPVHNFEITAYILDSTQIEYLKDKPNSIPNAYAFKGYYDIGHRVGKLVLKKETIKNYLSLNYNNYLYVVISKSPSSSVQYLNLEGQFSFVPMDYTFSFVPESFYIFSNLSPAQKNPHLYAIQMEQELGKKTRIEFTSSGTELDCKVLKYKNYASGSEEFYEDSKDFVIERKTTMGKTYIDITQANTEEEKFNSTIISIFSKNGGHIAGTEINKLNYVLRYTTFSDYGIYSFNDSKESEGDYNLSRIDQEGSNVSNISVYYNQLTYKKNDGDYIPEDTRFFIKLIPVSKRNQKIYESISLFEWMTPSLSLEINNYTKHFNFEVDPRNNYFLTMYTYSEAINEILSYKTKRISKIKSDTEIDDDNPFENDYDEEININVNATENITKNYLQIKISDFEDGEFGTLYVSIEDKQYKSVEPSNNIIIIPSSICKGKIINIQVKLKNQQTTSYFLEAKFVNQVELNVGENFFFEMLEEYNNSMEIIVNNKDQSENKMNIFIQSHTGDFEVEGLNLLQSDIFGAKSINIQENQGFINIKAKTGEYISLYTHIIDDSDKRIISNHQVSLYGLLQEKDCIYFEDSIAEVKKYQVRILSDKVISIKYNSSTVFEYTEPNVLYIKEFSEKLNKICLKQKNDLDNIFFSMQIIDTSDQKTSSSILHSSLLGNLYTDKLTRDEIVYYRQGLYDPNPSEELMYHYSIRQLEGEIKVYIAQCDDFPYCKFTKEDVENNNNILELYNVDEYFTYSKRSKDLVNFDPQIYQVFLILCITDSCEFNFIINKSDSIINLSKLEKYTSKVFKNNIDKYSIIKKEENAEILSISLYTHSGEVVLSSNDKCENIKHSIFGNLDKMEIPKICGLDKQFEIYVQANMDSVYSIEYEEIKLLNYSKIKSNIVHIENIINKEKYIEFTPVKNNYFVQFIPINCEIEVNYEFNYTNKAVFNQQNIYVYDSLSEEENVYLFNISTKENECMIYTYLSELTDDFYSILSDQVPYYLTLNKNNFNYKLIYPIPNGDYMPSFKINFLEEIPINITQSIRTEKDEAIKALFSKDIITNTNILKKCDKDNICYLMLYIQCEKELKDSIILEILPKSSNSIPGVLLDNKLKQDFVRINGQQQYMAKILKNEEGEINFNYKYFVGELLGKLIKIEKTSWKNRYDLPQKSEYLTYDKLRQRIVYTKKETEKCDNGCYLFIEVHPFEKYLEGINTESLNMDFSIYLKKSEKTVKLRLNEVIMGTLSQTIDDNYIEYYSIEVPYSTHKIYIDYSSENTNIIINSGYKKPTKDQKELSFDSTGKDQIYVIENNSKDLKGQNYIIGIYTNKLNNGVSQYSFRIRAEQELFSNYIISDISTENICVTKEKNQVCYFIIPVINVYKDSNLFLYGISTSNSDDLVISYKKIKMNENIAKNGKYIDDNIYTKTSKDQFIKNMLFISNTEMNLKEDENILINIESPEPGTVTLLHTFKFNLLESLVNPKNKEIFYINENKELYLNIPQGVKSLIHINTISGKGQLGYENDEQSLQEISGKYSSMFLQSVENNENRIKIKTNADSNFIFYAYMKIGSIKRNINEISVGSAVLRSGEGFPIEFYSKINEDQDYIINFNINNFNFKEIVEENKDMNIFNIRAYIVPEDIIEKIKLDDTFVYNNNPLNGKYEISYSMAKLVLNKDYIKQYYTKGVKNYIYLVIEDSYSNPTILNNILGEITIWQNNNIDYIAPNNVYINSNLQTGEISVNKYKLIKKNSDDKIMRIEFSPSSQNVKYKLHYNNQLSLSQDPEVDYTEDENFGKKNIDVNLDNAHDTIIFEIYNEKEESDINKMSYSLRYRTDKEKTSFKKYVKNGDIKIIKENKDDNNRNISLSIPTIKDNETLKVISAEYYLKIYKFSDKDLFINNTISIIDNLEPYKIIEFTTNENEYNNTITIPNDNKYYITVNAITNERELLSYNSLIIDIDNNNNKEEEKKKEDKGGLKWYYILLIILAIIIILLIIIFAVRYAMKQRENKIEVNDQMIPLTTENKI